MFVQTLLLNSFCIIPTARCCTVDSAERWRKQTWPTKFALCEIERVGREWLPDTRYRFRDINNSINSSLIDNSAIVFLFHFMLRSGSRPCWSEPHFLLSIFDWFIPPIRFSTFNESTETSGNLLEKRKWELAKEVHNSSTYFDRRLFLYVISAGKYTERVTRC